MRLLRWPEWVYNAEVHLELATAKPNAAARNTICRFWNLHQPKHPTVEIAGRLLFASRHRKLYVVY